MPEKTPDAASFTRSSVDSIQALKRSSDTARGSDSPTVLNSPSPTVNGAKYANYPGGITLKRAVSYCQRSIRPQKWSPQARRSKSIDRQLDEDRRKYLARCTALVTGSNRSQCLMRILEATNYGNKQTVTREQLEAEVQNWVIGALKCLCDNDEFAGNTTAHTASQLLAEMDNGKGVMTDSVAKSIEMLWGNELFRASLDRARMRDASPLDDILVNASKILQPGYQPAAADVAFVRRHESRTCASTVVLGEMTLDIIDPHARGCCGSRKWIKGFEDAPLVVFTYDMTIYDHMALPGVESDHQNSLMVFESIANSKRFQNSHIALLLLNITQFTSKLAVSPLSKVYPEYEGGDDPEAAARYIVDQFRQLSGSRTMYHHCADLLDPSVGEFLSKTAKEAASSRKG